MISGKKLYREVAAVVTAALLISGQILAGCAGTDGNRAVSRSQEASASESIRTSSKDAETVTAASTEGSETGEADWLSSDAEGAPEIPGAKATGRMKLDYASCFRIWYYSGGYKVLDIEQAGQYLVVPEDGKVPDAEDLPEGMRIIRQPLKNIYLAATSAMALFDAMGGLDSVTLSSLDEDGWQIDGPKKALAAGKMQYAGKYSEPDYEMLIEKNCDLAVESTMIFHTPDVQEMIEDLGITVLVDRSSFEKQALGRTEWIKLYAALLDREDEAQAFFEAQVDEVGAVGRFKKTGKTVAFFSVSSDGSIVIRRADDYIPAMIETAGGDYVFSGMKDAGGTSATVDISMEEFYSKAVNADYLVYNGTIVGEIADLDELAGKSELFREFKAFREGNVWQVDKSTYQSTDKVSRLILDLNIMMTDGDTSKLTFLSKVKS
uniref:ABC transporter substrate-binding protein n=1 Tax=Eubacterium cellulosolvens TaxID=29322 RepID=UPI0004871B2E|nr:ABC transporter substrate-binding protein [[Eubacterium] cellulosolvens]